MTTLCTCHIFLRKACQEVYKGTQCTEDVSANTRSYHLHVALLLLSQIRHDYHYMYKVLEEKPLSSSLVYLNIYLASPPPLEPIHTIRQPHIP